jgi:hypothetical protein
MSDGYSDDLINAEEDSYFCTIVVLHVWKVLRRKFNYRFISI